MSTAHILLLRVRMPQDFTNQKLFGLVSGELAATICVSLIAGSMAWQAWASDVDKLKAESVETRAQAKEIIKEVNGLKIEVSRVVANQKSDRENYRRMERNVEHIRKVIDQAYLK